MRAIQSGALAFSVFVRLGNNEGMNEGMFQIKAVHGDIMTIDADVIALKYAQAFYPKKGS